MISVADATARILAAVKPTTAELIPLSQGLGRVLSHDIIAARTQPPFAVSAMDGYALRAACASTVPVTVPCIGSIAAGTGFTRSLGPGEAVRIFTGAPLPEGADCVVIQENTTVPEPGFVTILDPATTGKHVRRAGIDFTAGQDRIPAGTRLSPRHLGLAAAMNRPWLTVHRRPRVAILPTGDEVALPGDPIGPYQIVSSNGIALAALIEAAGGIPVSLGIARDDRASLMALAAGAHGADLLITTGGASVGDHDLVHAALTEAGLKTDFWKIAMRPGKPLMFGSLGTMPFLGLPGNPVSALVCGLLFLIPLIHRMHGLDTTGPEAESAVLGLDLPANDHRQDYLRARLERDESRGLIVIPYHRQDSSVLTNLAQADCLLCRPPHDPALSVGTSVKIIRFGQNSLL